MKFVIFAVFSLNLFAYGEELVPVCDRTPQVKDEIVKKIQEGMNNASIDCKEADKFLDYIRVLHLNRRDITSLVVGDFSGLSYYLEELVLSTNELKTLPVGVFSKLFSLKRLYLSHNKLSDLPVGVFSGLSSLKVLQLHTNELKTLPAGLFSRLISLDSLSLSHNKLSDLPVGVFSGLSSLVWLQLSDNSLSQSEKDRIKKELPHVVFRFF